MSILSLVYKRKRTYVKVSGGEVYQSIPTYQTPAPAGTGLYTPAPTTTTKISGGGGGGSSQPIPTSTYTGPIAPINQVELSKALAKPQYNVQQLRVSSGGVQQQVQVQPQVQPQSQYVSQQKQQQPAQFYYKSQPGTYFGKDAGVRYYKTDERGNIQRQFSSQEVKEYGLIPTRELQASEKKPDVFYKIKQAEPVRKISEKYATFKSQPITKPFTYESFESKAGGSRIYAGTVPLIPAVPIFDVSKVKFIGLTQNLKNDKIMTQAVYEMNTRGFLGSTKDLVIVQSITQLSKTEAGGTQYLTGGTGKIIARERFGGVITKPNKNFASVEMGVIKQSENAFVTAGVGSYRSLPGSKDILYRSVGYGKSSGKFTASLGLSESRMGKVYSAGILKEVSQPSGSFFTAGESGFKLSSNTLRQIGLKSALSSIPVRTTATEQFVFSSINYPSMKRTEIKTEQQLPRQFTQQTTQQIQQALFPKFNTASLSFSVSKTKQRSRLSSLERTSQASSTALISNQAMRQIQVPSLKLNQQQRQAQRTRMLQINTQIPKGFVSFPRVINPKIIPLFPIKLPSSKQPKGFGGFNVFIRRRGKFKPIGFNLPKEKAFSLGEFATQKGLSQTFKIESSGRVFDLGTPKGYYKKQSKKGVLFIELPKTKINTASEKALLSFARRMKGGKKRR